MPNTNKLQPPGKPNVFGLPAGFLGAIAGWIMGRTGVEHNRWAVSLLNVRADDAILEIGFGPGVSIQLLARLAVRGRVTGVDPSPVMVRQATRRNAAAVRAGRVALQAGSVDALPFADAQFDKVLSVNNIMLWPGPHESLREVYRVLKPGGLLVIALNPRWAKNAGDVEQMGRELFDHVAQEINESFITI
ncbi:MAG: hypothetical protein JWN15_706 [Firmicutes bacterium]|nr:hypothetical protein [Bacillota bacterium]